MLRIITPKEWDLIKRIRNKETDSYQLGFNAIDVYIDDELIDNVQSFKLNMKRDFNVHDWALCYPTVSSEIRLYRKYKGANNETN